MTDSVEQCDRDAAQSFADDNTLCGCDKCIPVYAAAFARHRIAERERCAKIVEARVEPSWHLAAKNAAYVIAKAIREPKP
ncbi:MAG: hypothetical protein IPO08_19745 [Xanthomonadales bacterium]|nr:hypothetical protein [Xanthomonadales bacterium]